ncbi:MAG TPA: PA14 domain-containing protein, partial [Candidatus Acidoferrum sp.]|nr:PA14 domain-containing protein [Candidatus Acidoferrum sp.]
MNSLIQYWDIVAASRRERRFTECSFARSALVFVAATLLCVSAISGSAQTNGVLRQIYSGLNGSTLFSLTNNSSFPDSPTNGAGTVMIGLFETPGNFGDFYGDRYRALLIPPVTGSYVFWVQGDDAAILYLSPDESPNNKVQIAINITTALFRAWYVYPSQQSTPVFLEAGRKYYLEGIHSAGSGDDAFAVGWKRADGSYEQPMTMEFLYPYGLPAVSKPVIITQPTNLTVLEQLPAVFRVGVSNFDAVTYQWQRGTANILGARGATYSIPTAAASDNGATFRCVVSNSVGVVTSVVATLVVNTDLTAPVLSEVINLSSNLVQVSFSEPVTPFTATNAGNYTLNNGATVLSGAMGSSSDTVVLKTSGLQRGNNYTLTVNNVRDVAAAQNLIAANSQKSFTVLLKGIYREIYTDLFGSLISDLTNSAVFPHAPSSAELMTDVCETPGYSLNSYGQRLRALIIPPVTGSYRFAIAAHDTATLALGTGSSPASAQVIASVTRAGDVAAREWTIQPNQISAPVTLFAGQQYYFEVLMKSGISEHFPPDHLAVRWQRDGAIEEPISAGRFTPVGLNLPAITQNTPAGTNVVEGNLLTLAVNVSNLDPVTFQWQQNGTNIVGATSPILSIQPVPLANNGFTYRCLISNAQGTTNSTTTALTVSADTTRPAIVSVVNSNLNRIVVTFSEPMLITTATSAPNYLVAGIAVTTPVLSADGRSVTLNSSTMVLGNNYTITINRLRDRATTFNVIATNSVYTFTAAEFFPLSIGTAVGSTVVSANGVDMTGGYNDFSGTNDSFNFAYQRRVGDFDVKVRIAKLDFADTWSVATLMARGDLNSTNVYAAVCATPSIAGCFFQYRTNNGTAPGGSGSFPVNYPYTWLRLQRTNGLFFSGYASIDGQMWTRLGTVAISNSA